MAQIRIVITLKDDGNVDIAGEYGSELLTYGLLECARTALQRHYAKNKEKKNEIVVPAFTLPGRPS